MGRLQLGLLCAPLALLCACVEHGNLGSHAQAVHRVCATDTSLRGVDVSVYQGTVDWAAAAAGGVRFAMIRQSNGATADASFARNWSGARSAGILRGAYQYFDPFGDAAAQANALSAALLAEGFGPGDLPPMIDLELVPPASGAPLPSPTAYAALVRTWMDVIHTRLGVDGIVFARGEYWDANVASTAFASNPLWHAQWPNFPLTIYRLADPAPLGGCPTTVSDAWPAWTFWQFATDNGRAPGFAGAVSLSAFNGTMADLNRLARVPGAGDAGAPSDASSADAPLDAAAGDAAPPDSSASEAASALEASAPESGATDAGAAEVLADSGVGDAMATPPAQRGCGCGVPGRPRRVHGEAGLLALAGLLLGAPRARSRGGRRV